MTAYIYFLDPATFMGLAPELLIEAARPCGYDGVGMFLHSSMPSIPFAPLARDESRRREMAARLKAAGLRLGFVEIFDISDGADTEEFASVLSCAASLGAIGATAVALRNDDWNDLVARFGSFADLCAARGMRANVEFFPLSRALPTLSHAVRLLGEARRENGGLTLDILHLARSGARPEDVAALEPALIGHVQVCDGPATMDRDGMAHESRAARLGPGAGAFDLSGFAAALPPGVSIGVEVPHAVETPEAEARDLLAATKRFFEPAPSG